MAQNNRAYGGARYGFELQRQMMGWLHSAEGGHATTEVVQERLAGGYPVQKHPGGVKFEDISLSCGTGLSPSFYKWVEASINYDHQRKEGAIIGANYDFKEVSRLEFYEGLITEVGFPALDANAKEPCKLGIKISPEKTDIKYEKGTRSILPVPTVASKQKMWVPMNYRVTIDGMNTKRVAKLEPLVIKQKVIENAVGEELVFQKEPVQIDFPNLVMTIPEVDAEPWYKWHKSFVIDGKSDPEEEKGGCVEFLTPNTAEVLCTLTFTGLGIIKFQPDKLEASDKIRMVKIEMYCEKIKVDLSGLGS